MIRVILIADPDQDHFQRNAGPTCTCIISSFSFLSGINYCLRSETWKHLHCTIVHHCTIIEGVTGEQNKALSDTWCNVKFSFCFTSKYQATWRENLVVSLRLHLRLFSTHPFKCDKHLVYCMKMQRACPQFLYNRNFLHVSYLHCSSLAQLFLRK